MNLDLDLNSILPKDNMPLDVPDPTFKGPF